MAIRGPNPSSTATTRDISAVSYPRHTDRTLAQSSCSGKYVVERRIGNIWHGRIAWEGPALNALLCRCYQYLGTTDDSGDGSQPHPSGRVKTTHTAQLAYVLAIGAKRSPEDGSRHLSLTSA